MIKGSCLCGAIQFDIERVCEPFELCHCNRCRKVSGSAFMAGVSVFRKDFSWTSDTKEIRSYEAPLIDGPPAYRVCFCALCGSPVPDPNDESEQFEIAAGLLQGDLKVMPDKHIYVDYQAPWFSIADSLPQLDKQQLRRHRKQRARGTGEPKLPH